MERTRIGSVRRKPAYLIPLALLPVLTGVAQTNRRASEVQGPKGEGTIHGRVLSDRGQPVSRGRITLHSALGVARWQAITGAQGHFRFEGIPAGSYFLSMSHPRYVEARPKTGGLVETSRTVSIGPVEVVQVDFTAVRGGAITGTIVDRFGEPIPDVSVRAYRYTMRGDRRTLVPAESKSCQSNDLGQYRVANLPSGRYVVAADYRGELPQDTELGRERFGYAETWYPGHRSATRAQTLRVSAGQDRVGIDFVLEPTTFVEVSGAVVTSSGHPARGAEVIVRPAGELETTTAVTAGTRTSASGAFAVPNLPPGDYLVSARTSTRDDGPRDVEEKRPPEYGQSRVSVGNHSLHGVSIHLRPGTSLAGQVTADQLLPTRLTALLLPDDAAARSYRAPISARGDFAVTVGPGRYRLRMAGLPDNWVIERAWLGALDVSSSSFAISAAQPRTLTVRLSSLGAALAGTVGRAVSEPCAECAVVVMAHTSAERAPGGNGVRLAFTDRQGQFAVTGLRPGRYSAVALPHLDSDALFDEDFWQFVERNGQQVILAAGEHQHLSVPLRSYQ